MFKKKRCFAKSGHFPTHFNKVKLFEMMILIMLMIQYFIPDHQYGPSQCFVKVSICMDIFRKWPQYSENWPNNGVVRLMWAPRHKSEFYVLEIPSSSSINDIGSFCHRKGKYWLIIIEFCFNFGEPWKLFFFTQATIVSITKPWKLFFSLRQQKFQLRNQPRFANSHNLAKLGEKLVVTV